MSVSSREERILGIIETARAKRPRFKDERITMAHGAGGKATRSLVEGLLAPAFGIETLDDAGAVGDLALTTDAFVVRPLRFPGGSIGELAVNGTVNDLAMGGARPLVLTLSLILEEGLDSTTLRAETPVSSSPSRATTASNGSVGGSSSTAPARSRARSRYAGSGSTTTTSKPASRRSGAWMPAKPSSSTRAGGSPSSSRIRGVALAASAGGRRLTRRGGRRSPRRRERPRRP